MSKPLIFLLTLLTLSACENTRKDWIDTLNDSAHNAGNHAGR